MTWRINYPIMTVMDITSKLTFYLPLLVCFIYLLNSFAFAFKGDWPWFLVWGAYGVANIGLVWAQITGK